MPLKDQATPARRRSGRFRERSLLLNPAPVIGAALAAFAVAFGGLTLRLASGHDPAVSLSASAGPTNRGSATALSTRASGTAAGPGGASPTTSKANSSAIVTATSGGSAGTGRSPRGAGDA